MGANFCTALENRDSPGDREGMRVSGPNVEIKRRLGELRIALAHARRRGIGEIPQAIHVVFDEVMPLPMKPVWSAD
jgi:hypothetical protein